MAKTLVDTSIWIEFFRKREPYHSFVAGLIDDEDILVTGVVLAELLQGAKTEREVAVLLEFPEVFDFISETTDLWVDAGRLAFMLRRKGITIGLSDCYIAVAAASARVPVATLDRHFEALCGAAKVKLVKFMVS